MVITDLMDVAAALDAGLVPAEMVNPEFMDLLASSEKVVFGEDADGLVHRLITASLTGTQTSLGKDIPAANSTQRVGKRAAATRRRQKSQNASKIAGPISSVV